MRPAVRYALLLLIPVTLVGGMLFIRTDKPAPQPEAQLPPTPPVAAPAAPVNAAAPPPDLILDLFAPTPESLNAQQTQTILREQIEQALVVTFLLTRCQLLSQEEYAITYNALIRFIANRNITADLQSAAAYLAPIAQSAGTSYALVYSHVPCTDPSLPPARNALRQWRDQSSRTVSDSSINP